MHKAEEMAKTSAVGSIQLFFGTSISTIITAVATIILGWFISPADYGLYTIALVPAATLSLFQDMGVGSALTRYCAKYRGTNEQAEQRKVIIAGLIFELSNGILLMTISLLLSSFIAITVWGKPDAEFLITIASFSILFGAMGSAVGYVFTGFEKMKLNSYSVVIRALFYTLSVPLLVYFGYGALGAVIGYTLAAAAQGVISLLFLYFFIIKKLPQSKIYMSEIAKILKQLLRYGLPLSVGNILGGLSTSFYSFIMGSYVTTAMIGNYKIASNFAILLTFLTTPIATVLFPAFSKVDAEKEKDLLKTVYASSVKYTVLLVAPATMALMVLANPLIGTLYGNKWSNAPPLLALSVVFNLTSLIGWRSIGQFLPAVGETRLVMKLNLLALVISIRFGFYLGSPVRNNRNINWPHNRSFAQRISLDYFYHGNAMELKPT